MKFFKIREKISKSERLIYIIIFLWIVFGIAGIMFKSNLTQMAGYYASMTVFVGTYLWGEYKRTSESTTVFNGGPNSSREVIIYFTVLLWTIFGMYGVTKGTNLNDLTVYFMSLTPFVSSYIIYKTAKGSNTPLINKPF